MKSRVPFGVTIGVILLCYSSQGLTQGAEITGGVQTGFVRTDNVRLRSSANETDETVFQLSPWLDLNYEASRVSASIGYQFELFKYLDLGRTNSYHRYDATVTSELVRDTLFLDLGGSRGQSLVDPQGAVPTDGLPISGNLTDREEYFIGPRFVKLLGNSVTISANYRYADVSYDESDVATSFFASENTNQSASADVNNYKKGEGLTWAARYNWDETDYDLASPWENRMASAELGFWVNGSTRIFASGGKESAWDDPLDRSLQDEFWEAGFAYRNGDRLSAEFAAGERSFGSSWRGRLKFSFRRGDLSFNYAETPTINGLDRYRREYLFNPIPVDDLLTDPGTVDRYILERGQVSLNLKFRRTNLNFLVYNEDRVGRFNADGIVLRDESQRGISVSLSWQPGVRTEVEATGFLRSSDDEFNGKRDIKGVSIQGSYLLGESLGLAIGYSRTEQESTATSGGRNYVANRISLFLTYTF